MTLRDARSRSPSLAALRIGISGWRYAPWRGSFYPGDLAQKHELAWASRQFCSIELNGSFYSLQTPERYRRWHDDTPGGFVFSIKAPRYITHIRRLRDARAPLSNFMASGVLTLGDKLGPMLWQLPPSLRFDAQVMEAFLAQLPQDTDAASALAHKHEHRLAGRGALTPRTHQRLRHVMEVRHASFADPAFIHMLRHHGVALVVADTAGKWPLLEDVTADFMYLRLHGDKVLYESGYDDAALTRWAKRITRWSRGGEPADARRVDARAPKAAARDVYCYFDNDVKVCAPRNARQLMRMLRVPMAPVTPPDGG